MSRYQQSPSRHRPEVEDDWEEQEGQEQVIEGDLTVRAVVVGLLVG